MACLQMEKVYKKMKPSGLYAGRFSFSIPPNSSHSHTRSHTEGGGDGGKYRDDDVQNFAP